MILPNSNGMQLLLCYNNEGVYVSTYGKATKNVFLQWGETPSSVGMLIVNIHLAIFFNPEMDRWVLQFSTAPPKNIFLNISIS